MPQANTSLLPRILLVEDHDMTRRMQIRFLSRSYAVDFASTGEEAIELALEQEYAVVIVDIELAGGLTGVDVMRTLKHTPAHRGTAMVAVTGYSADTDREQLIDAGFDLYLAKPFRWQEFNEVIRLAVRLSAEGNVQPPPARSDSPYRPAPTSATAPQNPHGGDGLAREVSAHTTVRVRPTEAAAATRRTHAKSAAATGSYPFLKWQPLHAL